MIFLPTNTINLIGYISFIAKQISGKVKFSKQCNSKYY